MDKHIPLNTPISDIYFGTFNERIKSCLRHHYPLSKEFNTLYDLVTTDRQLLLQIRNMGKMSLMDIEDYLESYGLCLGMSDKDVMAYDETFIIGRPDLYTEVWNERAFEVAKLIEVELIRQGFPESDSTYEEVAVRRAYNLIGQMRLKIISSSREE